LGWSGGVGEGRRNTGCIIPAPDPCKPAPAAGAAPVWSCGAAAPVVPWLYNRTWVRVRHRGGVLGNAFCKRKHDEEER
jgi:hypothetical protein